MKSKFSILILLVISLFVVLSACSTDNNTENTNNELNENKDSKQEKENESVEEVTYLEELPNIKKLEVVMKNDGVNFVYFHGNTCPHCQVLNPIMEEITNEEKVKVSKYDVFIQEKNIALQEFLMDNNLGLTPDDVAYVPLILAFHNGEVVGYLSTEQYAIPSMATEGIGYAIDEEVVREFLTKDF